MLRFCCKSSPFHHHAWYGMCCFWCCASWILKSWVCSNATLQTWQHRFQANSTCSVILVRSLTDDQMSIRDQCAFVYQHLASHDFKCALYILFCFSKADSVWKVHPGQTYAQSPVNLICMSLGWALREDQHSHMAPSEECVYANS